MPDGSWLEGTYELRFDVKIPEGTLPTTDAGRGQIEYEVMAEVIYRHQSALTRIKRFFSGVSSKKESVVVLGGFSDTDTFPFVEFSKIIPRSGGHISCLSRYPSTAFQGDSFPIQLSLNNMSTESLTRIRITLYRFTRIRYKKSDLLDIIQSPIARSLTNLKAILPRESSMAEYTIYIPMDAAPTIDAGSNLKVFWQIEAQIHPSGFCASPILIRFGDIEIFAHRP